MTDPHDPVGVAKPQGAFWWVSGRACRREYWVWVVLLILVGLLLSHAPPGISLALSLGLLFAQIRRVHDLGRSGWWAVAAWLAPIPPAVALFYLANEDAATLAGVGLELILLITIGALPGEPADNRFGPPPPFTIRRVLIGR